MFNQSQKGQTIGEEIKEVAQQEADRVKFMARDPKGAVNEAVKSQ